MATSFQNADLHVLDLGLDVCRSLPDRFNPSDPETYTDLTTQHYDPFSDEQQDSALIFPPPPQTRFNPVTPWPAKLPIDLAMNIVPVETVLEEHQVDKDDYLRWTLMPAFRKALSDAAREVREQGLSFKLLCQGIAQDFLGELDTQLHNPTVAFSTKLDAFRTITKLAGLEQGAVKDAAPAGNMVNIQINL